MALHQYAADGRAAGTSPSDPKEERWRWQRAMRGIWIVTALALLVLFVVNIPALFQYAGIICTLPDAGGCSTEQLTPAYVQVLEQLHIPLSLTTAFLAALCVGLSVLYWLMGLLIFWRKSQDIMGWLVSLLLILFASSGFLGFNLPDQAPPFFQFLAQAITYWLMWPAMLVFFFTFPTGRFTPRWTLIAFVPFFVVTMLASLPQTVRFIPGIALILTTLLPGCVQIYRYRYVYSAVQRQQVKWFVFGLSVIFVLIFIQSVFGTLSDFPVARFWYQLLNGPFWLLIWTLVFVCVSVPILRHRLWDIDVIINRTLVYGFLTVLLVALYVGLILALQALVRVTIGSPTDQPWVIVISTLAIAVLFQPLRRALQTLIDRRFYRSKYDAARVTAVFGSALRNEVDLEQLCKQLLAVVEETMRPSHVSLWICLPEQTPSPPRVVSTPKEEGRATGERIV